jgi:beta-N-acetylhexosaminidase
MKLSIKRMKKHVVFAGVGFCLFFFFSQCTHKTMIPELNLEPVRNGWIRNTLKSMTLKEKIGQMIFCRYSGHYINQDSDAFQRLERLITELRIGGFILFGGDVYATALLTNSMQKMARVPLLISSDLERGLGQQIDGATLFPPHMSVAATGNEKMSYLMGAITAKEARAVGIHMTYAPVADVNINPENPIINVRSFGEDPKIVSRMAVAFIKGCQANGLVATAKHFPGHGDTHLDSHDVLPELWADRDRLNKVELLPFQKSIDEGVLAVMTAHLRIPAIDPTPKLPATLSSRAISDLLRKEMGFRGLIVTDAMEMGGISAQFSHEEAALRAVQAGVDILLLSPEPRRIISCFEKAVKEGKISERRLNLSVTRILEYKFRLGLHKNKFVDIKDIGNRIATQSHKQIAKQVFESSLTLLKNEEKILPLGDIGKKLAVFSLSSDAGGYFEGKVFINEFKRRRPRAFCFYADVYTGKEFIKKALVDTEKAEIYVLALFSRLRGGKGSVDLAECHINLIQELIRSEKPVVVVSFGSPYFIKHFPEIKAYLCAYRYASQAQNAAVKALFGELDIRGKVPVSIPGLYPAGYGLILRKKTPSES